MIPKYDQQEVIHCPNRECKGMLLQHPFYHEHKCSDCKQFFISDTRWFKTRPPKDYKETE